jgi:hypothetical protein
MIECNEKILECIITGIFAGIALAGFSALAIRYFYKKCVRRSIVLPTQQAGLEIVMSPFTGAALGVASNNV